MNKLLDESKPIYLQVKEYIEDAILSESLKAGDRVPSTNEFATFFKINPATAAKGVTELVDDKILYKRRGIGMFVADDAREILLEKRKERFYADFIQPLKSEAKRLRITRSQLVEMIEREGDISEN